MHTKIEAIKQELAKVVVGQEEMVTGVLVGLFSGGHVLLEGVPGLAKTTTVKALGEVLDLKFKRIQFTPDLLPSDILGAEIYDPKSNSFRIKKGAIFTQLLLADEINRSPSKVQSALLEAMQERQVTLGDHSFELPSPFMVLATQNPLEQEGVFRLPEAQLDRFMMKVILTHNSEEEELEIMRRVAKRRMPKLGAVLSVDEIALITEEIAQQVHVDNELERYIVALVRATRQDQTMLRYGASPRASIDLYRASKSYAYLRGKDFVTPVDIITMAYPVLRHRIGLSYEARSQELSSDDLLERIIDSVEIP